MDNNKGNNLTKLKISREGRKDNNHGILFSKNNASLFHLMYLTCEDGDCSLNILIPITQLVSTINDTFRIQTFVDGH
jgi:hypothetical protein